MKKFKLIGLAVLSIIVGISCATTTEIGLKRDFKKGNFLVGSTTKSDVVDFLGLPQKMVRNKNGTTNFIYPSEAKLTSMITYGTSVTGSTKVGGAQAGMNADDMSYGATYTFSKKGILVKKLEPKVELQTEPDY